jgi:hypothetical protein
MFGPLNAVVSRACRDARPLSLLLVSLLLAIREFGGLHGVGSGYGLAVSNDPHQSSPDEPDPKEQSTPAGVVQDLEEEAEEIGASTEPSPEPGQSSLDRDGRS